MLLSKFIIQLIKFKLKGIKYVDFYVSYDIPPVDFCSFYISDKTLTIRNFTT